MYPSFILVKTGEEEEEEIEMGRKHNYPLEINFKGLSPELNRSRRVMNTRQSEPLNRDRNQQSVDIKKISTVLVPPDRRLLEYCVKTFGEHSSIGIFIQPLLAQRIRSVQGLAINISELRKLYNEKINFSRIPQTNQQQIWFANQIFPRDHKQGFIEQLKRNGWDGRKDISHEMAVRGLEQYIKKHRSIQSLKDLEMRVGELKKMLFKYITRSNKKILVLGYGKIFKSLTATSFHHDGAPINYAVLKSNVPEQTPIIIPDMQLEQQSSMPSCGYCGLCRKDE